jgi:hypothetical protein
METNLTPIPASENKTDITEITIISDKNSKNKNLHFKKYWLYYLLLGLLLISNLYWFIHLKISNSIAEKTLNKTVKTLSDKANAQLLDNSKNKLELSMKALSWAIRIPLMRDNLDQIEDYFDELVKNRDILEAILVDENFENIRLSTNKKHEGMKVDQVIIDQKLKQNEYNFIDLKEEYLMSIPVVSIDRQIGTLILISDAKSDKIENKNN